MTRYPDAEIARLIEQLREAKFHPEHPAWEGFFSLVRPLTIIFATHADLRYALHLVDDDLDDLSQIVAEKLLAILGQYNPQYPFSAWLAKIVRNEAVSLFRRKPHYAPLDEEFPADPEGSADRQEEFQAALHYLRGFLAPQEQRVLDSLLQHYDQKNRVRQIAGDLRLSQARIYQILDAICEMGHWLANRD